MPLIFSSIIQGLFIAISEFLAKFVVKKVAKAGAVFAIMITAMGVFIAAVSLALSGAAAVAPDWIVIAWGWFMPSNATACMSAYGAIHLARWVYDQNTNFQTSLFK